MKKLLLAVLMSFFSVKAAAQLQNSGEADWKPSFMGNSNEERMGIEAYKKKFREKHLAEKLKDSQQNTTEPAQSDPSVGTQNSPQPDKKKLEGIK